MSKQNITIVYSAIIREKHTILAEYTEFSGNFSQIITQIMKDIIMKFENIPNITRSYFFYGKYALFFLKYKKLYIITMFPNIKLNNKEIIFAFLYSIYDSLKSIKEIDIENVGKMKAYSLSSYSKIFEEKIKLFNSNRNSFISLLKNLEIFEVFDIQDRNFESDAVLPILSRVQTHVEKKNKEEDEDEIDKDSLDNKNLIRNSFNNSILTYDSFKDDFLNDEKIENDISLVINNNTVNNNIKNENLVQEIEIKEFNNNDLTTGLNLNDTKDTDISIKKYNKCCRCSLKKIIIIIVIFIIIMLAAVFGIIFFI